MSSKKDIPTPRTDAECANNGIGLPLPIVRADFARQLERELALLREKLADTQDELSEFRSAVRWSR